MAQFYILTLGCQMNVNDSQWLARALEKAGHQESPLKKADFFILNTCSVRDKPEKNVHSTIGRFRKENPQAWGVVLGCVAQQLGKKLTERHESVRLVLGTDALYNAPFLIDKLLKHDIEVKPFKVPQKQAHTDFIDSFPDRDHYLENIAQNQPIAYVNIMQGCDNFCSYCIVPYTRGIPKSRSTQSILDECKAWLQKGVKEIHLLGQNVNTFGQDRLNDGISFPELLKKINALPQLKRLRFITPHPKDLAEETIQLFADLETLCPRLHLPLQSGSDSVLKRMNRVYSFADYMKKIEKLKKVRPDIVFASDLIVGFPGETDDEFQATLNAVQSVPFIFSYSFPYSDRPGTKASTMTNKIPQEIQLQRLEQLQSLQKKVGANYLKTLLNSKTQILIEGKSKKSNSAQGKDVYGNTIHVETKAQIGEIIIATITQTQNHSLIAKEEE